MTEKLWSISQVCQATGLTTRTLRHYDAIGLLKPQSVIKHVRFYSQDNLLLLQRILTLRQLGLSLDAIAQLISQPETQAAVFEQQATNLRGQIARMQQMLESIELTQLRIQNRENIVIEESFNGFDENPYAAEAQARWPQQFEQSQRKIAKLPKAQQQEIMQQHTDVATALAALFIAGATPSDEPVQVQIAKHYRWICNFWIPSREAYINLGRMYVADERFAANYNKYAPGLAQFICDAIELSNLGD